MNTVLQFFITLVSNNEMLNCAETKDDLFHRTIETRDDEHVRCKKATLYFYDFNKRGIPQHTTQGCLKSGHTSNYCLR